MTKYLYAIVLLLFCASCDMASISNFFTPSLGAKSDVDTKAGPNGIKKSYYDDGKLMSEIPYKDNLKHGLAKNYYPNGKVKLEITYVNGVKEGVSKFYYKDGQLYRETAYVKGKKHGVCKKYAEGKLKAEILYSNDSECQGLKEYYLDGKLKKDYPSLVIKTKDDRYKTGKFHLIVQFDNKQVKDQFWVSEKPINECLDNKKELYPIKVRNGIGDLEYPVKPSQSLMKKLYIAGGHTTKQKNLYVTAQEYNLVIK